MSKKLDKSATISQYTMFQHAIDFTNEHLFSGRLPPCLITLQRKKGCMGYFSEKRYISTDGTGSSVDEIAINPTLVASHGIVEVLQTVVHEQCHQWQYVFGKPSQRTYHNKEWADKMESLGLMPSHNGKPGGRKTGQNMQDYPIEGGLFMKVARDLLDDNFQIPWADRFVPTGDLVQELHIEGENIVHMVTKTQPHNKRKICYQHMCPIIQQEIKLWGKPGVNICCGECGELFKSQTADSD